MTFESSYSNKRCETRQLQFIMKEIQRHTITERKVGDESLITHYEASEEKAVMRLSAGKNMNFFALKDFFRKLVLFKHMQGINQDPVPALIKYLDLGLAHIKRTEATDREVEVEIFDKVFRVTSLENDYGADYYDRYQLYNVAKLINSQQHIDKLLQFDQPDPAKDRNPFWRAVYDYIKATELNQDSKRVAAFRRIEELSDSNITTFIGLEGNSLIEQEGIENLRKVYHFSIMDLYECIYQNATIEFEEKLESYIVTKKAEIIRNEQHDDMRYWLDFDLLGVLSTAKRRGMEVKVKTDYAPAELQCTD